MSTKTYAETDLNVEFSVSVPCFRCSGTGVIPWGNAPDEIDQCQECEGHGEWLEPVDIKEENNE